MTCHISPLEKDHALLSLPQLSNEAELVLSREQILTGQSRDTAVTANRTNRFGPEPLKGEMGV